MTIEFETPYGKVPEQLITFIRNEILKLSHKLKNVSRAQVLLQDDAKAPTALNKVCQIRLSVRGSRLSAQSRTEDFEKSAKRVIKELRRDKRQKKLLSLVA